MTLKYIRSVLTLGFLGILCISLLLPVNVRALSGSGGDPAFPDLETFIAQVKNGQASQLRGIYIPGILAARIIQQPGAVDEFVSPWQNVVTEFSLASKFGSTGLLAHNYLAGKSFAMLEEGKEFYLVDGDGHLSAFIVSDILQYQAFEPDSTSSAFMDMASGEILTYSQLFTKMYNKPGEVILQTCIDAQGNAAWGRLFIIAQPSPQ